MPDWSVIGPRGSDRPHAIELDGVRIDATRGPHDPLVDRARETILCKFPADDRDMAIRYFNELLRAGIKSAAPLHRYISPKGGLWRYRGTPHYIAPQAFALKIPSVHLGDLHHN